MSMHSTVQNRLYKNPVAWRESLSMVRGRSRWWRAGYIFIALLFIAPFLFANSYFAPMLSFFLAIMALFTGAMSLLLPFRTMAIAVDTMARERRGNTWELLMLSNVSNRQVVAGKWLGIAASMWRDYALLAAMRIGVFLWVFVNNDVNRYISKAINGNWRNYDEIYYAVKLGDVSVQIPPQAGIVLMIIPLFLFLELILSTSIGMSAAFFSWSHRAGVWVATGLRTAGIAILFGIVLYGMGFISFDSAHQRYIDNYSRSVVYGVIFPMADHGLTATSNLLSDSYYYPVTGQMLGLTISGTLFLTFSGISMAVANYAAARQGFNLTGADTYKAKKRGKTETVQENIAQSAAPALTNGAAAEVVPAHGTVNVFNLQNPDAYQVEIFNYARHLSRLLLRITTPQETRYLKFSGIRYLQIPSDWQGANFCTLSESDYQQIIQTAGIQENALNRSMTRLYAIPGSTKPVYIVAGHIELLNDL